MVSHCLVYWSEVHSVTVFSRQDVQAEHVKVGEEYSVKWGRTAIYTASVAAVGECVRIRIIWLCGTVCMHARARARVCVCVCVCVCSHMFVVSIHKP